MMRPIAAMLIVFLCIGCHHEIDVRTPRYQVQTPRLQSPALETEIPNIQVTVPLVESERQKAPLQVEYPLWLQAETYGRRKYEKGRRYTYEKGQGESKWYGYNGVPFSGSGAFIGGLAAGGLVGGGGGYGLYHSPQRKHSMSRDLELQQVVSLWYGKLPLGNVQYNAPDVMYWKHAATVSVVIRGPKSELADQLVEATGGGALKVSDRMKVVVSCPDNPDEFNIVEEGDAGEIQFVPLNGSTTWHWMVTPKYTGRKQKLRIQAWVLYPGKDDKILRELPVYSAAVDVKVPGIGESLKRLLEGDPDYWIKYGLPGGGGFIFAAGIFAFFLKRAASRKDSAASLHNIPDEDRV